MSAPDQLRVGLVGCGFVSQHHLKAWQAVYPKASVVALADPSRAARDERGGAFAIACRFETLEQMLDAVPIDAVDIASPRETHAELVRLAAARGLPVLCQKPLAPTYAEAEALIRNLGHDARVMVHENWRFRPYVRRIRGLVSNPALGPVKQVFLHLFNSGMLPDDHGRLPAVERQPFFAQLPRMLVTEILIHHIDALRSIFGDVRLLGASIGHSVKGIVGDDFVTAMIETVDATTSLVIIANLAAHGFEARVPDSLVVLAQNATIKFERNELVATGALTIRESFDPDATYASSFRGAIENFVECLLSGAPFETASSDNLKTLRIVEDIYEKGIRQL